MGLSAGDGPNDGKVERRSPRTAFAKHTLIHLLIPRAQSPVDVEVSIFDFSPGGLGMTCDTRLDRGQQFTLRVGTAGGRTSELLYSVAHCRPAPDESFIVGAEFTCMAAEAVLTEQSPQTQVLLDRIRRAVLEPSS